MIFVSVDAVALSLYLYALTTKTELTY